MSTKKITTKAKAKSVAKPKAQAPAKKPPTKLAKPQAKPTTKAKPKTKPTQLKSTQLATRRPDPNQPPSVAVINSVTSDILLLMGVLENYAANLRALDRQRHNGHGDIIFNSLGMPRELRVSSSFFFFHS